MQCLAVLVAVPPGACCAILTSGSYLVSANGAFDSGEMSVGHPQHFLHFGNCCGLWSAKLDSFGYVLETANRQKWRDAKSPVFACPIRARRASGKKDSGSTERNSKMAALRHSSATIETPSFDTLVEAIAARYTKAYFDLLEALDVEAPTQSPRATDHIVQMIDLIGT